MCIGAAAYGQVQPGARSTMVYQDSLEASGSPYLEVGADFLQTQYLSPAVDPINQADTYSYVNPHFLYQNQRFIADLRGVIALNTEGDTHFYFPEFFYGDKNVAIGRKKYQWSQLDQDFQLGLWQPLFRWDHTRPTEMGLTGLFLHRRINSNLNITVFASPIFLPDQQPDYKIEDGKVISGNRWVRNPIDSIDFLKNSTTLKYNVLEPDIEDVIFRQSVAAKLRFGGDSGYWGQVAWTQKPNNQFHLGVDISESYDSGNDELAPRIHPVVVDHRLLTLEMGYKAELIGTYVSFTQERFSDPHLPSDYIQTQLADTRHLGLVLEHELMPSLPGQHRLIWSANQRSVMDEKEAKTRIEGEVSASTQRMAFERWLGLDYKSKLHLKRGRNLQSRIGYRYSPEDAGEWVTMGTSLQWSRSLSFFANADLLGANQKSASPSFISYYSNNDRFEGGISYVF